MAVNPTRRVPSNRALSARSRPLNRNLAIEAAINALRPGCEKLAQQLKQLCSVPSIGKKSAPHLLALLHRFYAKTAARHRQTTRCLCRPDPNPLTVVLRSSIAPLSPNKATPPCVAGFSFVLWAACVAATICARSYLLLARGKAKKLALIACARKALVWAWAVFTQGTTFDSARFVNA